MSRQPGLHQEPAAAAPYCAYGKWYKLGVGVQTCPGCPRRAEADRPEV